MTSYYFYYPFITYEQCRSSGNEVTVSNRRQCRRQSFHLLCVYNEVLGPLTMRQSSFIFSFGLPIDTFSLNRVTAARTLIAADADQTIRVDAQLAQKDRSFW